ncbi:MAG: hypothetical protein A3F09_00280 [Chlamydiae bacterium RIFCSPHIGHO2_12_FULL_49_11]|nr:MAG: hypothetical protein A3F09_00280 [Chlamydiae bacterium RIFCSPHIGHO2_12_FULL_49_11]
MNGTEYIHILPCEKIPARVKVPSSKSDMVRALFFGMIATGESLVHRMEETGDTAAACSVIRAFGGQVIRDNGSWRITAHTRFPDTVDVGESGILYRYVTALAAGAPHFVKITGGPSLAKRPIAPLLSALGSGRFVIEGRDSQLVSCLLSTLFLREGDSVVDVISPGELSWIDFSLAWLARLGIRIEKRSYEQYLVFGGQSVAPFTFTMPSDPSLAFFFAVLSMIHGKPITISHMKEAIFHPDWKAFTILQEMGAGLEWEGEALRVLPGGIKGIEIDINHTIDSLPALAVLAVFGDRPSTFSGVAIAREKESNRVEALREELGKMGVQVQATFDTLTILPGMPKGAILCSHNDHRIAMALGILATKANSASTLMGYAAVQKTFPDFFNSLLA